MMSSGQYLETFPVLQACDGDSGCDWVGIVEARFDPEIDRHSYVWDCVDCGRSGEVQF